jgi:hypothetical protein
MGSTFAKPIAHVASSRPKSPPPMLSKRFSTALLLLWTAPESDRD